MAIKNMAESVLARLKQQAKEEGIVFQTVLQLFAQEEFLRRLANSKYAENMILKGGMFIYMLTEFDSRLTRDIDFMIRRLSNKPENIENIMKEICNTTTGNDFITIEVLETELITVRKKYPGVKTKFVGYINKVRIPFSVDVGIDDVIVPEPIKRKIATRLSDFKAPEVYTYSLESTIAEKLDAILQRMDTTSRMKDFYDIYYLSEMFDFDGNVLHKAISATLEHRHRELATDAFDDITDFINSEFLTVQWNTFKPAQDAGLTFETALDRLKIFLEPVYEALIQQKEYGLMWNCENKKWE